MQSGQFIKTAYLIIYFQLKEKGIICLLPENMFLKHRESNERIFRDGLLYSMDNDTHVECLPGISTKPMN